MPLSEAQVAAAAAVRLRNGQDVTACFERTANTNFIDWFDRKCAGHGNWKSKSIGSTDQIKGRFSQIWNAIPDIFGTNSVNLLQFCALTSIIINEAGANLFPASELCGRQNYPGLTYAFERVPGVKRSYNSGDLNTLAGTLFFDDPEYWSAHGNLAPADLVRAMPNLRDLWNSSSYPRLQFPSTLDPQHSGFIQQADFYKFRGRGFVQVTWRENYKRLVDFVQTYTGEDKTILHYRQAWLGRDPNSVCTASTNEDWDTLFQQSGMIIPCRAIGIHNQSSGHYLSLAQDLSSLTAQTKTPGSFYYMGLRISGGDDYAALFSARVVQILETLAYSG